MLKRVIEYYQVDFGVDAQQLLDSGATVFADGHGYVAPEFLVDLVWLVADVEGGGAAGSKHETSGLALVAARYHADAVFEFQQVEDVFDVGGLACAADGEVAHHHDRHVKLALFQDAPLEHQVAYPYPHAVQL